MFTESIGVKNSQQLSICVPPLPPCDTIALAEPLLWRIVPVKNEAQTLAATLTALAHQTDLHGKPLSPLGYEVIILANNCTDRSAAIAREIAKRHPLLALHVVELTLPPDRAYIGYVRKLLMDAAYCRLMSLGKPQGIIASTDGDTQVAATWIAATRQEISGGVDAVGGRIITDRISRHALSPQAKTCFLQEVGYRSLVAELEFYLDPDPYDPLLADYLKKLHFINSITGCDGGNRSMSRLQFTTYATKSPY
jgi:Glycosyl transferase family 2